MHLLRLCFLRGRGEVAIEFKPQQGKDNQSSEKKIENLLLLAFLLRDMNSVAAMPASSMVIQSLQNELWNRQACMLTITQYIDIVLCGRRPQDSNWLHWVKDIAVTFILMTLNSDLIIIQAKLWPSFQHLDAMGVPYTNLEGFPTCAAFLCRVQRFDRSLQRRSDGEICICRAEKFKAFVKNVSDKFTSRSR